MSRREIREALALPDSTVRSRLADLVELEYLAQVEAGAKGAGKTSRYRLVALDTHRTTPLGLLSARPTRSTSRYTGFRR